MSAVLLKKIAATYQSQPTVLSRQIKSFQTKHSKDKKTNFKMKGKTTVQCSVVWTVNENRGRPTRLLYPQNQEDFYPPYTAVEPH